MAKKRSIFDIDFELEEGVEQQGFPAGNEPAPETKSFYIQGHPLQNDSPPPARRGPMASAISETADATAERAAAELAIRAENDALAHEHVRLKKLGLITDLIQTAKVQTTKLTRDRSANVDPELAELKASIQAVGLSNPIRVEKTAEGYELIQGFRRLTAFRELAEETGDPRYTRIPAAMVPRGEPLVDLYRKMVDENLVRKDLSFGEMAQLAIAYANDAQIDSGEAVSVLYASALKQKRSYIRQFSKVLGELQGRVLFAESWPRAVGLGLCKALEADPQKAVAMIAALDKAPDRDAAQELGILKACVSQKRRLEGSKAVSKTTIKLTHREGEVKVTAEDGRIELRLEQDFSAHSKARLQSAVEAFLDRLKSDG